MTTKERLHAELETLTEDDMAALLQVIQTLSHSPQPAPQPKSPGLLSRLKQIQIDAPADFAAELDRYMNGEDMNGEKLIGSSANLH